MLRHTLRRLNWHSLQEFALQEADAAAFRRARVADGSRAESIAAAGAQTASIDWAKYQSDIRHQDLVTSLKTYHDQQIKVLDGLLNEDHVSAVQKSHLKSWDAVYDSTVKTAKASVAQSESIVANGAKALYISHNNPAISSVSTQEWLDTDQYWQAFVEKHQYYHNHLDCVTEDPESKEYDDKMKMELMKNFKLHDETHPRKELLYQRPSYEYYTMFKGPFVEHMLYYLVKTGGDARMFPELMPHSWFNQIYEIKWKLLDVIQERRRKFQMDALAREMDPEFHPHDCVAGGEEYYSKLIQKENVNVENQVARLMGNYIFLSEGTPLQTSASLYAILESGVSGKFFSLGDEVNALFFKPDSDNPASPAEAASNYLDHLTMTGRKLSPVFAVALVEFCKLLEARKASMGGCWFNVPGESQAQAFLRRVRSNDPLQPVFEEYVADLESRWASATEVSAADAATRIGAIEDAYYNLEVPLYMNMVLGSDNPDSKAAADKLSKMMEAGTLSVAMESGKMVAFDNSGASLSPDDLKKVF
jgi:hypothetical protein